MTKQELFNIDISNTSEEIYVASKHKWDSLSKPLDGMGDFEELICKLASIQEKIIPDIDNRTLLVFCADNGVVANGISQSGQEVTAKVARMLGAGESAAATIAKAVNAKLITVDVGINADNEIAGVINNKVAKGTEDFLIRPAMTEEELVKAIQTGIELVQNQARAGAKLIVTGEMGIGNTTTSTAVLATLLDIDSELITGRGAGLDNEGLIRKREVIRSGIDKYSVYFSSIKDEKARSFEILRCLGGLDIAAMCGAFIGGAMAKLPVLIDGVISATAALLADRIVPGSRAYMIASHSGREKGISLALEELGLKTYIAGNMALGEGTGALMLLSLIDNALFLYKNGLSFEGAGIEEYERFV